MLAVILLQRINKYFFKYSHRKSASKLVSDNIYPYSKYAGENHIKLCSVWKIKGSFIDYQYLFNKIFKIVFWKQNVWFEENLLTYDLKIVCYRILLSSMAEYGNILRLKNENVYRIW